ncbi:MAG: hypothetical protein FGF50_05255 [Candidatus Brockarchaeota archaeon]|nr:hypothetical protein [Candidatus Brockarchaeota archaeon]
MPEVTDEEIKTIFFSNPTGENVDEKDIRLTNIVKPKVQRRAERSA